MWVIYVSGLLPAQGYTIHIISASPVFVDGDTNASILCYSPTTFALILYQVNHDFLSLSFANIRPANTSFPLTLIMQSIRSNEVYTDP